jgi:hypothetical protein
MRAGAARLLVLAVAVAAAGAVALSLAPLAQAAGCGQAIGVSVVLDFGNPGGTSIGCAAGDSANGLDTLKKSGHSYTFIQRQPGFVCTIDARPDPCNNGPATAYWSYWHALPGGSWSYATTGAGSYKPASGSIDGWSFGAGMPPSSRPPVASSSGAATANPPTAGATIGKGRVNALGARTPASATRSLSPDSQNGLGGLALGVALVVLLGGTAAYLARRRRHVND